MLIREICVNSCLSSFIYTTEYFHFLHISYINIAHFLHISCINIAYFLHKIYLYLLYLQYIIFLIAYFSYKFLNLYI